MTQRANPEELLKLATQENARSKRGRLKIFFGFCAGVGKTYAMLQAATLKQNEGVAVGVGVVETHERVDTQRVLDGLPVLPLKTIPYQGRELREFDLDGALASNFELILVDEFAHSNVPGSRHAKRWQDVEELLDAGIDVYTTLNVQHLDSLNDIVGGITGIRVHETVPDRVFDDATEVVLIDLPPEELLARLAAGKVYLDAAAAQARQNFFRKGNLIALRELALRRVADRVNSDVRSYRVSNAIQNVWPTNERLIVCVRTGASQDFFLREGARLAHRLQTDWIVLHVDRPSQRQDDEDREYLRDLAESACELGAEFVNIPGEDVAQTIVAYARMRNASKMVLGRGALSRWQFWEGSIVDQIARASPDMGLILVGADASAPAKKRKKTAERSPGTLNALAWATLFCALTAVAANGLVKVFDLSNVAMLFQLTVILVALRLGRAAGAWAAFLCVLLFNFFYVKPVFSFTVSDTQYLFTFILMLVVALIIGQLALRLKLEAKVAIEGEKRAAAMARVARDLSAAIQTEQIAAVCTDTIAPLLSVKAALILPDLADKLIDVANVDFVDLAAAQWVYDHDQMAGMGTQTLSAAKAQYLPLKAPMRVRGVLAICPAAGAIPSAPDDRRLLEAFCSSIAMALERIHFVEIAQETLVKMEGERLRKELLAAVTPATY